MLESQRLAALVVSKVLAGHNLNETLDALWRRHSGLTAQQRAASQDMSYGTLRFYGQLRAVLDQLLKRPLRDERITCLLLVGLYQLHYSKAPAHAVVDHAVNAAVSINKGAPRGLVNAVLRNFLRSREPLLEKAAQSEVGRYSHPQWWIDRLKREYPQCYEAILDETNRHPPMALRVNRRRIAADAYLERLREHEISAEPAGDSAIILPQPVPVERLPGFSEGLVSVQDLAAQWAAPLLEVKNGMRVLDACAAPGGKSAHLLELARIDLTALDNDRQRLSKVEQNLARLGLSARVVQGDAAEPDGWWDSRPFDRILADVPCSASGVARRHPDIKWLRRESDIPKYAAQQRTMLDALWQTLARDGKLLYATCSVFADENRRVVEDFLRRHEDAKQLPLPGVAAPDGQLLPSPQHDGLFYALLSKA